MERFKNIVTGHIHKYIGTFSKDNVKYYKTGEYSGIHENMIEETIEAEWIQISFNCRLKYGQCQDCIRHIRELGGDGNTTVGGSWYVGSNEMIQKLVGWMAEKGYDLESLSYNEPPNIATKRRLGQYLKNE